MSRVERKLLRKRMTNRDPAPPVSLATLDRESARTTEVISRWIRPLLEASAYVIGGWVVGIGSGVIAVVWGWL